MLELTFFNDKNEQKTIPVSQFCYERLAKIGFSKKVKYQDLSLIIEGEECDINVVALTVDNREILLSLIEYERQENLEMAFGALDKNPTIKEIRESFFYIKELTEVYKNLKIEENIYFSYE